MITAMYTALLALFYLYLSWKALRARRMARISVGTGESEELLRAVRVHANFAEYAPYALLILFMLEQLGGHAAFIHVSGLLLVTGRTLHAWGLSQLKENYHFRKIGMGCTFISIGAGALYLLWISLMS